MHDPLYVADVAVVGAGPAGASAAYLCAAAGLKTVLIEKANPPRYKTCGGGVLARAARLLPVDIAPAVERECREVELHFLTSCQVLRTHRPTPLILMTMRDRLDALLTQAAVDRGTTLLAQTKVVRVREQKHHLCLTTNRGEISAGLIIAADGMNSLVARQCGFVDGRRTIPALELEVMVDDHTFERLQTARFDFDILPLGYGWVFPKRNHLSIGVVSMRRGGVNLNQTIAHYLRMLGITHPLEVRRHGYSIPITPRRGVLARGRVFLAGDAAGLVDPVTGEGISAAITSGQWAARCVIRHLANPAAATRAYNAILRRHTLPELRAAAKLAYLLYECPRLRNWLFRRHGAALTRAMMQVVTGQTTYRALLRSPLNYVKALTRSNELSP